MEEKNDIPVSKNVQEITKIVSDITSTDTDVFIRRSLGEEWVFTEIENDFIKIPYLYHQ